jgi:hypothetical protein
MMGRIYIYLKVDLRVKYPPHHQEKVGMDGIGYLFPKGIA